MRRRKLLVALALGLAVLVAAAVWPRTPRGEKITLDNWYRTELGMSPAQLKAILGPPGDYSTGPTRVTRGAIPDYVNTFGSVPVHAHTDFWTSDTFEIWAAYDKSDVIVAKGYCQMEPEHLAPLDNLRWHVKRQWRQWFPAN
jgi:hypothetical protein